MLSNRFDCCRSILMTRFKNEYGLTINQYLTDVRLAAAVELLQKSQKSVKEIAAECGFSDQNYFSRLFTNRMHCSPTVYRDKKGKTKVEIL